MSDALAISAAPARLSVVEVLGRQHVRLRHSARSARCAESLDRPARCAALARLLGVHESAERAVLAPLGLSAGADMREMLDHSRRDEHELGRALSTLDPWSIDYDRQIARISTRLDRHLDAEERSLFPLLDALLGDERSHRMARFMERAVERPI
jgi:hypothetical protein